MTRSVLLIPFLAIGGCTVIGPSYNPPEANEYASSSFIEGEGYIDAAPGARWWRAFGDPALDALVAEALAANNDLGEAIATVNAARAQVGLARLDRLPFDTITATYTRQRQSASTLGAGFGDAFGDNLGSEPLPSFETFSLSAAANWEVDLWGRVTRTINIARADLEAAEAQLADVQSIVIAETVDAYVALRGAEAQLAVAQQNVENQRETVSLVTVRRDAGRGSDLDVDRAVAQLATTEAVVPPLEAAVAAERYRLGVLLGRTPQEVLALSEHAADLPVVQQSVPVGDVAGLLRRRPDIRAAERRLASASERIGLNVVSAFPTIQLTGSVGVQSIEFDEPFSEEALNFAYGPAISWSLTDLLRARQRVAAASARAQAAFEAYERTVLSALAETETALASQRAAQAQVQALATADSASTDAARLARLRFENGAADFLEVLDAERRQLEAADQLAAAKTRAAQAQVTVFRALRAGPTVVVEREARPRP